MKTSTIIKTGYYILKSRLLNKRIPLSVVFKVIKRCNFDCEYCNIWQDQGDDLKTEQIYLMFDELAEMGTQNITLYGGEPLLRKDIGKIINYGKEKGFFMALNTNAYLLPKKIDEIKNVDRLLISLDGSKEVNDSLRLKGSYDSIIESIELANEYKIPVHTYTVLTKCNIEQIDFILSQAEKLHFKANFLYLLKEPTTRETVNEMFPSKEQYQKAVTKLIKYKKSGKPIINSFEVLKYMYDIPHPKMEMTCWAGKLMVYIESDGGLYACVSKRQHKKTGKSFPDISLKQAFEELYIKEGKCKFCLFPGLVERNNIYSLKFETIFNRLKNEGFA